MISKYTNIERLVTEMPSAQRFSFIAMDCEPIKNALRNATGRWTLTFTQYLEQYIEVSVRISEFIELMSEGIRRGRMAHRGGYDEQRQCSHEIFVHDTAVH